MILFNHPLSSTQLSLDNETNIYKNIRDLKKIIEINALLFVTE